MLAIAAELEITSPANPRIKQPVLDACFVLTCQSLVTADLRVDHDA